MKSKIDEIYEDIESRLISNPDLFTIDISKNIKILSEVIQTVNLAKSTLVELETEYDNGAGFLMYKLQKDHNIPFGMCDYCAFMRNSKGFRIQCDKDKKIKCLGVKILCKLDKKKKKIISETFYWKY